MKRVVHNLCVGLYVLFVCAVIVALFNFVTLENRGMFYSGDMGGMTPVVRGEATDGMIVTWALMSAVAGGMLMMAIYNLALCLFRRGEKAALYFSFTCIACGVRIAFHARGVVDYVSGMDEGILLRIQNIALCMIALWLTCFIFTVFDDGKRRRLYRALVAIMLALTAALSFVESNIVRTVAAVITTPSVLGICIYVVVMSDQFRKHILPKLYLLSFLFFIFGMISRALISFELPFIAVNTNFFFMLVHSLLLSDRYARAITAVEKANDELEEKVAKRTSELAASEKSVRDMVAGISHDIKTPMSVLSVNIEVALEAESSPEIKRHLSIAYNKSADIARLVRELLSVGDSGKTVYNMTWFPLASLLGDVISRYEAQMEADGIDLNVSYRQDCRVWIDEHHIWRVLDNILGNAQRYTKPGGAITVSSGKVESAEAGGGVVCISVSDNGDGIEPEHLPHIFDRYYKADKSRGIGGAGLGLYIAKTAVEAMGGTISAHSEPGKGTKISILLTAE